MKTKSELKLKNTRSLGYEDAYVHIQPAEPCPKPRTVAEIVKVREIMEKEGIDIWRYNRPDPDQTKNKDGKIK